MSSNPLGDLTPMRAIVLPGMAETAEPDPAQPAQPGRLLPRLRKPTRVREPQVGSDEPSLVGVPVGDLVTRAAAGAPGDPDTVAPPAAADPGLSSVTGSWAGADGADESDQADPLPDAGMRPPARRRRGLRAAVAAAAVGLLIGPLVYSFVTGSGGDRSPRTAVPPPLVMAQPGSAEPSMASQPGSSPTSTAVPPSGSTPASNGLAPTPSGVGRSPAGLPAPVTGATASAAPQPSKTTTAVRAATSVKTSGVGCANDLTQNWYTNGMDGGWSEKSGGAGGCGRFVAMPMSGDQSWNGDPYVVWWFETSPVVTGSCAVTVYIPSSPVPNDVAGHPAYYKVLGGRTSSTVYASFSIDQTVNRGRWVSAGTYPVSNGAISIHLGNRGADPNGERLGAAQVRVSCTQS